ncbi:TetR/AcrR family transcriptional regulator [Paractinoplanes rishiriensis]|uniref:TetR family transcriptional regulator n=1 Tax=Paractinoplanes rishiriensis TaxID=1050105 RepID=A0A919JZ68_9ACTN|nr:TetR/AcrR family transcriptional regulator [Actinoplanes rishiriensis]GIE96227.1 TetR family transcriptional regulator [Actinoplanes rishiriensis]
MNEPNAVAAQRGETYGGRSRQQRSADRRDRILAAALQLFGTRDYEAVTVADVCTAARVAKRYFYDHFIDRCDLLRALHRQQNEWLLSEIETATPKRPSTIDELLRPGVRKLLNLLRDNPERAQVIYLNTPRMDTQRLDTQRRGVLHEGAAFLGKLLRPVLGRPDDNVRHELMLLAAVAGVSEVIIDWLVRGMTDDLDQLTDHLTGFCSAIFR